MRENNKYIYLFFLVFSLLLTVLFVGVENFWFNKISWLYGSGDLSNAQLSWQFYKNDVWRFPLGKNPNYGLEVANSIIFTDNIPLLALLFKLIKPIIYNNFQYFSFWIFICFYLQVFFSFKILKKFTQDNLFSFLGSLIFLFCPFLLFRLTHHFSLGAHWIILYAFYIVYFLPNKEKEAHWFFVIFISLVVHLYFTVMIILIYFFSILESLVEKGKIKSNITNFTSKIFFSLIIMYVVGYFESSPINAVSSGYGLFKIDLFSFFDPQLDNSQSWSLFLKNLPGTHLEGFTYIGLGNILLTSLSLTLLIKNKIFLESKSLSFKILRPLNICFLVFFIWSLSTNISLLGYEILNLDLPKYLFALLSIFSSTGRFAWPVIYFILFIAVFCIYKNLYRNKALCLILLLLVVQISDISVGIFKNSLNSKKILSSDPKNEIWELIDKNFEEIRTTYLFNNYGPLFSKFSPILGNLKNIKTDIILNAAMDRVKAAKVRYQLARNINDEELISTRAYLVDNLGHLKQLKKHFLKKNYGFLYRDNFWIILPGQKRLMNENDYNELNKIPISQVEFDKEYNLNFMGDFLGFGWSHNFGKPGVWSEGEYSYLLFKLPKSKKELNLKLKFDSYIKNLNENFLVKILINEKIADTIYLNNKNNAEINLYKFNNASEILIKFQFENLVSPWESFESPDARKLGILLKSFVVEEIT
jgi:hypothetical protein